MKTAVYAVGFVLSMLLFLLSLVVFVFHSYSQGPWYFLASVPCKLDNVCKEH